MTGAHPPRGYPSWVFEADEGRAGTDAPGDLYQEGPASESPSSAGGQGGRGSSGGRDRMDRDSAADLWQLLSANAEDSLAAEGPRMARSPGARPGFGVPLQSS